MPCFCGAGKDARTVPLSVLHDRLNEYNGCGSSHSIRPRYGKRLDSVALGMEYQAPHDDLLG